jgi:transaldolase
VNVTLIFSLERYRDVMLAYINGLADRADQGLPIDSITGVASFFISRVDTEIDRRLESIGTPTALALRGHAAVSQARLAYSMFREVFSGEAWSHLRQRGARLQRPLWASTSTKNPSYPDTLYVDQLIGPDSVNTLPESTIDAFCDHGTIERTIDRNVDESRRIWQELASVGVDVTDVARVLEDEGIKSFQASFDDLMKTLSAKRV